MVEPKALVPFVLFVAVDDPNVKELVAGALGAAEPNAGAGVEPNAGAALLVSEPKVKEDDAPLAAGVVPKGFAGWLPNAGAGVEEAPLAPPKEPKAPGVVLAAGAPKAFDF